MNGESQVRTFAILNFVMAGFCLLIVGGLATILFYGIYHSGDPPEEIFAGVLGTTVLGLPALLGLAVHTAAGIGLSRRKPWAWGVHIAGAGLAVFTCLGIIYSVFAFVAAFQPQFKAALRSES